MKLNDQRKYYVERSFEGCGWKIYASIREGVKGLKIRSYIGKHTFQGKFRNKDASSNWISEKHFDFIRNNQKMPNFSRDLITRDYNAEIPDYTL